jgi:hypothetical protein
MDLATFKVSLKDTAPPDQIEPVLQALWHEARGDWDKAHRLAQSQGDARGAWGHAYLHGVEGDRSNAAYWYRRVPDPQDQHQGQGAEGDESQDRLPREDYLSRSVRISEELRP